MSEFARPDDAAAARDFAEAVVDTMRDPLLVLDADLRVARANREFYRAFGVDPAETAGRLVYELGDGQWDIPRLRDLLEDILPRETEFRDFEVEHTFEHVGRKVMLLNARRLRRGPGLPEMILLVIEDVTARRDAEASRRAAEQRFTEMVKHLRDHAIFLTDPAGVVISWNVTAEHVLGYAAAEAVGRHYAFIFTPEDVAAGTPEWELRTAREQGRAEDERWHLRKGGERFWALGVVTPLRDAGGALTGFSKILRDMTERKRAEEALRQSETAFRLMVRSVEDHAFVLLDPAGNVASWNEGAQRLLGYAAEEVLGRPAALFFTDEDRRAGLPERELRTAAEAGRSRDDNWLVSRRGVRFWASGTTTALRDAGGGLRGFAKVFRDLTERRQAEEALRRANAELEGRVAERTAALARANAERAGLLRRLVAAQEDERGRIARELHDQTAQVVVALGFGLQALERDVPAGPPRERLHKLQGLAAQVGREVRHLAFELRPAALDELGLADALARYAAAWSERFGVPAACADCDEGLRLPAEAETALYRTAQEALANVAKHAGAGRVRVTLRAEAGAVALAVADDGRGFDPAGVAPTPGGGLGVPGMRERLEAVGGTLAVESAPGRGTTVTARVPLPATT